MDLIVLATLKGETLTIPLGAMAPGFVAPKFEVPINGFTYTTASKDGLVSKLFCWLHDAINSRLIPNKILVIFINYF